MGRPKGSKNKKTLEVMAKMAPAPAEKPVKPNEVKADLVVPNEPVVESTKDATNVEVLKMADEMHKERRAKLKLPPSTTALVDEAGKHHGLNVHKMVTLCEEIAVGFNTTQTSKWSVGVGPKSPPHFKTIGNKMASVLVSFFDLNVTDAENKNFFLETKS